MIDLTNLPSWLGVNTWHVWFVTMTLIVAAVIDGLKLKVPNWLTYPMILSGWVFNMGFSPYTEWWGQGLLFSLIGTGIGLGLLLPAYAIGGMGAGDVKLLAGVGAWMGGWVTFYAFAVSAIVGGILAIAMVLWTRSWQKHKVQFFGIANEIITIKNPEKLSEIAAERKPRMFLLPYGIPIAIGTIACFAWRAWHGMYL